MIKKIHTQKSLLKGGIQITSQRSLLKLEWYVEAYAPVIWNLRSPHPGDSGDIHFYLCETKWIPR